MHLNQRIKNFPYHWLEWDSHSFRIGSVSLIRQIQTLHVKSSCLRKWGWAPPHDKHMAIPAWLLKSFLLRYATILLARIKKPHLVPWDQKVKSLKFKLCLKLSMWKTKKKRSICLPIHISFHMDLFFAWLTYCKLHFSLVSTFHKKVSRWFVISFLFIPRCAYTSDYYYVPEFLEYLTYEL